MPAIPFDIVLFDLDGTLADTVPDITSALNHALVMMGRPSLSAEEVRGLVGHGARRLIQRTLSITGEASDLLVDRAYTWFMDYYLDHPCGATRPYPGAAEALDLLADQGLSLGICTNKPEAISRALLDALGWSGKFASLVGGDTLAVRKPDPAPLFEAVRRAGGGRAAFVGDSIVDGDAARAAAMPFVAVTFGYSDRPADSLGADLCIDHYQALAGALVKLHDRSVRR